MAAVRDPAFWRRFSVAAHLDEEAQVAKESDPKHSYVASPSPTALYPSAPGAAQAQQPQQEISPSLSQFNFEEARNQDHQDRSLPSPARLEPSVSNPFSPPASIKTNPFSPASTLPPTPSLSHPHSLSNSISHSYSHSASTSRSAPKQSHYHPRTQSQTQPQTDLPAQPAPIHFDQPTEARPESIATTPQAKHKSAKLPLYTRRNTSQLTLGLSGRPASRFKFWTSVSANPAHRESWLEEQRRKKSKRTCMCWGFWIVLFAFIAAVVVTILLLKARGIL